MKNNFRKNDRQEQVEEMMIFLSLCNEHDRKIIEETQNQNIVEDYVRLMIIARTFDFKRVFLELFCHTGSFESQICEYLSKIEKDKDLVFKWIEDFIDGIENNEIKELAKNHWVRKLNAVNKVDFNIRYLFNGRW